VTVIFDQVLDPRKLVLNPRKFCRWFKFHPYTRVMTNMAHKQKPEASIYKALRVMAIEGVKHGVYSGPKHVAAELGDSLLTLKKQFKGRKS
jgi:hypothetical protein